MSNKVWMRRLKLILELERWVADNLKPRGLYNIRERTPDQKLSDARDYVYGYLFWGRRKFPDAGDPLFFNDDGINGYDESMKQQLIEGKYDDYIVYFNSLDSSMPAVDNDPVVEPSGVVKYIQGTTEFIIRLRQSLVSSDPSSDSVSGDANLITAEMIGLVLRYRCVGGFASNMHGSIDPRWAEALPGFTECFASPLNHKFQNYHSMFDEDCYFGGKGDFFKFVKGNGGTIPPGKYEINPPFHEGLLGDVATLIESSFSRLPPSASLQMVVVVPDWTDTSFVPVLDTVSRALCENGKMYKKKFNFTHSNGGNLPVRTRFYVLCSRGCSAAEITELQNSVQELVFDYR